MMARGRGRGFGGRPRGPARPVARFLSRPTFDPVLAEPAFPRVKPISEETDFNQELLNLNTQLSPTDVEEAGINNLMTKVRSHLDKFILTPVAESSCQIEEVRPVGSFKKGTMMRGNNVADLVIILKSVPARDSVDAMGMKLCQELNEQEPKIGLSFASNERGFILTSPLATVKIMVATIPSNMKKLDSSLHLDYKVLQQNMAAVRQCRWFEESAHHSSIRVLIRIMKHLKNRYELLSPLTPWIIDLLAHYCIMNHPNRQVVPLPAAFRRALQLMAAGLFLPGSQGLIDPVESYGVRAHTAIPVAQQDGVTIAAQTLLQILAYGGYQPVLGLDGSSKDLTTEVTVWNGVVVTPGEEAYIPTPASEEPEQQDVEMEPVPAE